MPITSGIDVGTGAVKVVVFEVEGTRETCLAKRVERLRQRDPLALSARLYDETHAQCGLQRSNTAYCATTGEGGSIDFHTGPFYSMTTHARAAVHLNPASRAALDAGALHGRAIRIDPRGKVLGYQMTSQCTSGSGQFLENIARYLAVGQDEIGSLSLAAGNPERVSGICAVLAETDVINMVSRGLTLANILRGIHQSMADRLAKLLKAVGAVDGPIQMTGGSALDGGLVDAMKAAIAREKVPATIDTHPDAIYAGAIGAALWGAFRSEKLARAAAA